MDGKNELVPVNNADKTFTTIGKVGMFAGIVSALCAGLAKIWEFKKSFDNE